MKNEKPAKGTKGFVFADFNGNPVFRVYNYDKKDEHGAPEFVDYKIGYCDIEVEVIGGSAVFAEGKQGQPILTLASFDPTKDHIIRYKGVEISKEAWEKLKRDKSQGDSK